MTFSVPVSNAHLTASSFPCRLTAFVYKSFAQASHFIYIDDNVQAQTLMWLASKQKPDGCFRSVGTLFNNALKVIEKYFLLKFTLLSFRTCRPITVRNYTPNACPLPRANSPHLTMTIFSSVSFPTLYFTFNEQLR